YLDIMIEPAPTTCTDDGFENNDSPGDPAPVTEGTIEYLRSCELDDDYFSIPLSAGDEITIEVIFVHAAGDIQLALINPSGTLVASSESASDNEQITYTAPGAGIFVIWVYLFADLGVSEGNDYDLDIMIVPAASVPTTSPLGVTFLALLLGVISHRAGLRREAYTRRATRTA
ncbi:MAG: pre-peptidase C-terminal domain-containing protein, partial [Deltaproteobacteria bacterium]|nr:pre-peptidase C-terminal domain-containing protein [Deltaproteobacteria bacterium]